MAVWLKCYVKIWESGGKFLKSIENLVPPFSYSRVKVGISPDHNAMLFFSTINRSCARGRLQDGDGIIVVSACHGHGFNIVVCVWEATNTSIIQIRVHGGVTKTACSISWSAECSDKVFIALPIKNLSTV